MIRERWRLVDILLLRLPRYEVQLGGYCYVARGSRYGERLPIPGHRQKRQQARFPLRRDCVLFHCLSPHRSRQSGTCVRCRQRHHTPAG